MCLGNFSEVPTLRTYLHLLGHYKKDEITCIQMANKLRELYPEYYYRIIDLCKKEKISLFTNFYCNKSIETKEDYQLIINKSLKSFKSDNYLKTSDEPIGITFSISFTKKMKYICTKTSNLTLDIGKFQGDLNSFSKKVSSILKKNSSISDYYIYGRDLKSVKWCQLILATKLFPTEIQFIQTKGLYVIESSFNIGGLINKYFRMSIPYYEQLLVKEGIYYNLIIPELIIDKFLVYDISDFEKTVLDFFSEKKTLQQLLEGTQHYFEDDVINNYYSEYEIYIKKIIMKLIQIKAILPVIS